MPGHCDNCEDERLAQLKRCKDLQLASMKKVAAGESPNLELPETSEELAEQLGFYEEEERERFP